MGSPEKGLAGAPSPPRTSSDGATSGVLQPRGWEATWESLCPASGRDIHRDIHVFMRRNWYHARQTRTLQQVQYQRQQSDWCPQAPQHPNSLHNAGSRAPAAATEVANADGELPQPPHGQIICWRPRQSPQSRRKDRTSPPVQLCSYPTVPTASAALKQKPGGAPPAGRT